MKTMSGNEAVEMAGNSFDTGFGLRPIAIGNRNNAQARRRNIGQGESGEHGNAEQTFVLRVARGLHGMGLFMNTRMKLTVPRPCGG